MDDIHEDDIWDAISEHAKGHIDYRGFSAMFPFPADNFLSSVIYGYAVGRAPEVIAAKIEAQVFMTGRTVDPQALRGYVREWEHVLQPQIGLTARALQRLNAGEDEADVLAIVQAALS